MRWSFPGIQFAPRLFASVAGALFILVSGCATAPKPKPSPEPGPEIAPTGVQINSLPGKLGVVIGGKLFTEYHYTQTPKPYLFPIIGPTDAGMTRSFPMASPEGEEHDHPHHRSLWFAHGLVNGHDFWTETKGAGRIVHDRFTSVLGGEQQGIIRSQNKWTAANGKIICTDDRSFTFYNTGTTDRLLDFEITIHADHGDLIFGDTKEGTMALRIAETLRLTGPTGGENPESRVVNSEGAGDTEAWGKRAKWCDYSGLVNGRRAGIALFDHPQNPRFPTWWMVRDYGLLAANPFGQHEFEKLSNENVGDLKIPAGQSVTFRYRILFHVGTAEEARLAECFEEFAAGVK